MTGVLRRLTVTFDPDGLSDGIRRGDPANAPYRGEFGVSEAVRPLDGQVALVTRRRDAESAMTSQRA